MEPLNITTAYESELNVIGCFIQFPNIFKSKIKSISSEWFSDDINRQIFDIIARYNRNDKVADIGIIIAESGQDEKIKNRILEAGANGFQSTFENHLDIIKTAYKNRITKKSITQLAFDDNLDYNDIVSELKNIIEKTEKDTTTQTEVYLNKFDTFCDNLYKKHLVIKTGFSRVDYLTGGLRKGTVTILGARPSTGKTALALNIAEYVLKNKKKVAVFSLEMSSEMIIERIACTLCHIQYSKFANKSFSADEAIEIEKEVMRLKNEKNLYIIDDIYRIEHITEKIAQIKPDFAVVDFIQIVNTVERKESERVKINYISAELKSIAKKTNACIMVLSQLKRSEKNEMPTMADLKESGGLEQDGDYIFLLHRPYVGAVNKKDEKPDETYLRLDKNKFGKIGDTLLNFSGEYQRFMQIRNNIG